jgi:hypothetical protein
MWYRNSKIIVAQGLNVVGPAMPTPQMPNIPAQPIAPNPQVAPQAPQGVPIGAELPPLQAAENTIPEPPVHDNCHCSIKTMPGGRRIWEFSNNACNLCRQMGEAFNAQQASIFGI